MANVIDSLLVTVKVDVSEINKMVTKVGSAINKGMAKVVSGVNKGMIKVVSGVNKGMTKVVSEISKGMIKVESKVSKGMTKAVSEINKGMTKVNKGMTRVVSTVNKMMTRVNKGMAKVESRLSAGAKNIKSKINSSFAGVSAAGKLLTDYIDTAKALGNLSKLTGVSVEELDAWGQAAKHSGGSAEAFQDSIQSLNSQIRDAAVFGEEISSGVFRQLGIDLKDANGDVKSSTQVLQELAGAAETMDKAQISSLLETLGIDQGTVALLQSGRDEVNNLVGEMKKLSYTGIDAEIASDIENITRSFQMVAAIVMRAVAPAISLVADKLQGFTSFLAQNDAFVLAFFGMLAAILVVMGLAAIKAMLPFLLLIGVVMLLAFAIQKVVDAWQGIKEYFGFGKKKKDSDAELPLSEVASSKTSNASTKKGQAPKPKAPLALEADAMTKSVGKGALDTLVPYAPSASGNANAGMRPGTTVHNINNSRTDQAVHVTVSPPTNDPRQWGQMVGDEINRKLAMAGNTSVNT